MAETARAYSVGDTVISLCPLVAPPVEPSGVRLEIPKACLGLVVDVRPYECGKPYAVVFDVAEGASIEIDVADEQIAKVNRRAPIAVTEEYPQLPPLQVRNPKRRIRRHALYQPTASQPHHHCKPLHVINALLMGALYGCALALTPKWVLVISAVVLLGAYGNHVQTEEAWSWVPSILKRERLGPNEQLIVDHRHAASAWKADALFALSAVALLVYHFVNLAHEYRLGAVAYFLLVSLAAIVWSVKTVMHYLAADVQPSHDN